MGKNVSGDFYQQADDVERRHKFIYKNGNVFIRLMKKILTWRGVNI
jgi:hypothetical protein